MEQSSDTLNLEQVRLKLGISMFRDKKMSIAAAARVANKPLTEMLTLLSEKGIPVVNYSQEDAKSEAEFAEKWIQEHINTSKPSFE